MLALTYIDDVVVVLNFVKLWHWAGLKKVVWVGCGASQQKPKRISKDVRSCISKIFCVHLENTWLVLLCIEKRTCFIVYVIYL